MVEIGKILESLLSLQIPIDGESGSWPQPPSQTPRRVDFGKFNGARARRRESELSPRTTEIIESHAAGDSEGSLEEVLDVLAWYSPFHFYGDRWGIYLREDAILMLAGRIGHHLSGKRITDPEIVQDAIWSAVLTLYFHEAFHHYTESFATRLELIEREERYRTYHHEVYARSVGEDEPLEEALACADMIRRQSVEAGLKSVEPAVKQATLKMLNVWIPGLSHGYCKGLQFTKNADFSEGRNLLSALIQTGSPLQPGFPPSDHVVESWRQTGLTTRNGMFKSLANCRDRTYLVGEQPSSDLLTLLTTC